MAATIIQPLPAVRPAEPPAALRVEVISDYAGLVAIEPAWTALEERSELAHPFLTYAWVRAWWESFGARNTLHILLIKEGRELIGIAPLMLGRRKFYGINMRSLEFISNVHTPRFDFLIAARHGDVYRAIWEHVREIRGLWDVMLLCQIPEGSLTLKQFSQIPQKAGFPVATWKSADSPYLQINGGWESYLESLRPKYRSNILRRMRRLKELGTVSLEEITSKADLDSALADGLHLEGAVWKDSNKTSIRSDHTVSQFYSRVATSFLERQRLAMYFLRLDERRIAFQYAVRYRNREFSLKPGYDPEYAQCSPSNLLCTLFLQQAFRSGLTEFDFLGVEEEWKMQWTQTTRPHYWLFIFSNSLLCSLLYSIKFRWIPALRASKMPRRLQHVVAAQSHPGELA